MTRPVCERDLTLIRELLQSKVDAIDATIAGLRRETGLLNEVVNARLLGMDEANRQLKVENERRFVELNALRKEYTDERGQFVSLDFYNAKMDEMQKWKDWATNQITAITTRSAVWTAVLGIFFTIIMIAAQMWGK